VSQAEPLARHRPDTHRTCQARHRQSLRLCLPCVCPVSVRLRLFACVCSPASVRLRLFACICSPASVRLHLFACVCSPASVRLHLFACVCSPASVRLCLIACVCSPASVRLCLAKPAPYFNRPSCHAHPRPSCHVPPVAGREMQADKATGALSESPLRKAPSQRGR
jgi:hypothetical protein